MATSTFVVDRSLEALPLTRLLDVRARLKVEGMFEKPIVTAGDRPVLNGNQALTPNTLYAAEKNGTLRYYLPEYRVSVEDGQRPAVQLRYQAGDDDEVGRLTIALAWTAPRAAGLTVRAMDHVASLGLRFRVPVQDANGNPSTAGGVEQTIPLQPLQQAGDLTARSTTIFRDKTTFNTVYQALCLNDGNDQVASLDIQIRARVGIRTWRQVIVGRPTEVDQAKVLKYRGALFTDMVHKESLGTLHAVPSAGAARIRLTAPPPDVTSRVDATRTVVARPETRRMVMATPRAVSPAVAAVAAPRRVMTAPARPAIATMRVAMPAARISPAMTVAAAAAAPAARAAATPVAVSARPSLERATLSRVNTPKLAQAVAVSDLRIANRAVVPIRMVLDTARQPAIVDGELENRQSLPFSFDPGKPDNDDVFAVEGFDRGGIHLLLPLRLTAPDGSAHVVYQDNLMRDVVHIAPNEFRLERDATAPFLPSLSFLASEFGTTDGTNDEDADVLFRVAAVYRLEPWLDPDVVELARAELATQGLVARFTTSVARDAALTLDLDLLGNEQQRGGATVDPARGITDTLELDHTTFVRLWRERLSNPASGGITGNVEYKLFDGSPVQVKVRLSLWEASSELFDVAPVGGVDGQPGRYRVVVRNRIESPARVTALPSVVVSGGATAHAVDAGSIVGQVFQPQESREIMYDVSGGAADVDDLEPTVLARAEPNLPALLKLLMLTPGYASLGFSLAVKAAATAFAPSTGGGEALTGLLVEFDDGSRATLTPSQPQMDVSLVGRLLDQILGTGDDSQRYFYRVTNLHASGEGARTSWLEGRGAASLEVGVAAVRLDF